MALRFRKRLTLTISTLIFLVVFAMTVAVAWIFLFDIYERNEAARRAPLTSPDNADGPVAPIQEVLDLQRLLNRLGVVVAVGLAMAAVGVVVSVWLSRGLSRPIVQLSEGARQLGAGNLNYRLYWKRKDEFQELAQSFNIMAISLQEYMHELKQESAHRERLESEVRIAGEVQETLLPERPPDVKGLELAGYSRPSRDVGGDFYDYFEVEPGVVCVVLGDATGKGLSAALLSSQCASILRTLANSLHDPAELLTRTNREFFNRVGPTHRFVTLFAIIADANRGIAKYASAGHPPPILINANANECRWLTSESGFPLGIFKDSQFTEKEIALQPGDKFVLYSDGLTDAQNPAGAFYGDDQVVSCIESAADKPPTALLKSLRECVQTHMAGREPTDDLTLVAMGYRLNNEDTTATET